MATTTPFAPRLLALVGALALGLLLLTDGLACSAKGSAIVDPVPVAASVALATARRALEAEDPDRARAAAEEAQALAPDWLAPARVLDEMDRTALMAPLALARRLAELAAQPADAGRAYLAGRLEGEAGMERFVEAIHLDPDLAWSHHALAWYRFADGDAAAALAPGRRAVERARDPWERMHFSLALARYLAATDQDVQAVELLQEVVGDEELPTADRVEVAAWLAVAETGSGERILMARGIERVLSLLEREELTAETRRRIVDAAVLAGWVGTSPRKDIAALLATDAAAARQAADLHFRMESPELALARLALVESSLPRRDDRDLRAARLAAGDVQGAIEDWLAWLPAQVRGQDGLPRDERLARMVRAARNDGDPIAFGTALVEAGWFREARGFARHLVESHSEAAASLEARALRGESFLRDLRDLVWKIDSEDGCPRPWRPDPENPFRMVRVDGGEGLEEARPTEGLDDLLRAVRPLVDRYHGGAATSDVGDSPYLTKNLFASVLHPGPAYSALDEAEGRGTAGTPVYGMASELASLGRFGIFGEALGNGGPDATIRRVLWIEEVEGEHLGVPFRGTVAWCEGADLPSRPERRGANITGAALHEGYWIDVVGVHADYRHWAGLEERAFRGGKPAVDVDRALASRGPAMNLAGGAAGLAGPRSLYAMAGLSDLVRLAVLRDRGAESKADAPWSVTFEELLHCVAVHEEGHLCDRTRFLPLTSNVFSVLGLAFDAGLSPTRVAEYLEYRAQLVALCVVPEPRMPLADVIDAAEGGMAGTPHGAGYRSLLEDLLEELDGCREDFPALSADHFLVHQLHHLPAEEVQDLALRLARRKGMIED